MKSLLIGEAASPEEEQRIQEVLAGHRATRRVVSLRSLYLGPEDLLVEAKLQMDPQLAFDGIAAAIDEMEAGVREQAPPRASWRSSPRTPAATTTRTPGDKGQRIYHARAGRPGSTLV